MATLCASYRRRLTRDPLDFKTRNHSYPKNEKENFRLAIATALWAAKRMDNPRP